MMGLKPWEVDRMDCTDVEGFQIILQRVMELMGGEEELVSIIGNWS
jgi:hypothetical protein